MSVEFEEDNFVNRNFSAPKKGFSIVDFLVDRHLVKDERTANMVLLAISLLVLIGSSIVIYNISNNTSGASVKYSDLPIQEKLKLPKEIRDLNEAIEVNKK